MGQARTKYMFLEPLKKSTEGRYDALGHGIRGFGGIRLSILRGERR